jgi:ATP-dependent protease HslVU (ClpYQ) peptidase subunit
MKIDVTDHALLLVKTVNAIVEKYDLPKNEVYHLAKDVYQKEILHKEEIDIIVEDWNRQADREINGLPVDNSHTN